MTYDFPFWQNSNRKEKWFYLLVVRVIAPGSAHSRPSTQPPIDTREIFQLHVFGGGHKSLKKCMINFLAIFFLDPKSYICRELKPHGKFQNPTITPSGRKVTQGEREEEEKIVDTQCTQAARTNLFIIQCEYKATQVEPQVQLGLRVCNLAPGATYKTISVRGIKPYAHGGLRLQCFKSSENPSGQTFLPIWQMSQVWDFF